jgi:hypothetical protein
LSQLLKKSTIAFWLFYIWADFSEVGQISWHQKYLQLPNKRECCSTQEAHIFGRAEKYLPVSLVFKGVINEDFLTLITDDQAGRWTLVRSLLG